MNIKLEIEGINPEQLDSLLAFAERVSGLEAQVEQTPDVEPNKKGKRVKMSNEERKARARERMRKIRQNPEYRKKEAVQNKAYYGANREQILATHRLYDDRRRHAHLPEYQATSAYKKGFRVRSVTSRGQIYMAYDPKTSSYKLGATQTNPETRLQFYRSKQSPDIKFIAVSPVLNDVYAAEAYSHTALKGNVRYVQTKDKTKDAINKSAEWFKFQPNGFALDDVKRIFDEVSNQFTCNKEDDE